MGTRRWSPGRGWIKLVESGDLATWVKPDHDGLFLALYIPAHREDKDDLVEHWVIHLPRGSDFLYDILDKPWRIRWLLRQEGVSHHWPGGTLWGVRILLYEVKQASHKRHKERFSRRHCGWRRSYFTPFRHRLSRPWECAEFAYDYRAYLPRKVKACLEPGLKQIREWHEWSRLWDLHDRQQAAQHAVANAALEGKDLDLENNREVPQTVDLGRITQGHAVRHLTCNSSS